MDELDARPDLIVCSNFISNEEFKYIDEVLGIIYTITRCSPQDIPDIERFSLLTTRKEASYIIPQLSKNKKVRLLALLGQYDPSITTNKEFDCTQIESNNIRQLTAGIKAGHPLYTFIESGDLSVFIRELSQRRAQYP